jgi:hypothetical protein
VVRKLNFGVIRTNNRKNDVVNNTRLKNGSFLLPNLWAVNLRSPRFLMAQTIPMNRGWAEELKLLTG